MVPRDTHPEAHRVQMDAFRAMTPARRLELALEMSDDIRSLTREGIARRHPEFSHEQISRALITLLLGKALARSIWR
jgi:Rv0078B-related antitoxin